MLIVKVGVKMKRRKLKEEKLDVVRIGIKVKFWTLLRGKEVMIDVREGWNKNVTKLNKKVQIINF